MAHGLSDIDWSASWWTPWRARGALLARQIVSDGLSVAQALNAAWPAVAADGLPRRFVPQAELPEGQAYEDFIFRQRQVPTRDNLHDFFNGLVWLHLPQAKARLNALQAGQIAADGIQPVRGPLRDALTLFDENAALLQAPEVLWNALLARDWLRLFVELRPLWREARLLIFGHALLEKLVQPRKPITAHVYRAQAPLASLAGADAWLAAELRPETLASKPFTPLPVLGVPGWWPANERPDFYADAQVFRAPSPLTGSRK